MCDTPINDGRATPADASWQPSFHFDALRVSVLSDHKFEAVREKLQTVVQRLRDLPGVSDDDDYDWETIFGALGNASFADAAINRLRAGI